jgi:hypothetical protein
MKTIALVPLTLALAMGIAAAKKQREWQTGTVLDTDRESYFAGTIGSSSTVTTTQGSGKNTTYHGNTNGSQAAVYHVYETFLIKGQTHTYLARQPLRWRWSKPASVTVNGPVKFSIEKNKLFVLDENDKEHEMRIVKKILNVEK